MRIVAVADTHLYHAELRVPQGDVFIHAGDLCRSGELRELVRALDWMNELPHRHKLVVAGNHDWAFQREPERARQYLGRVQWLHDSALSIDGISFWGSPWQPEFGAWAFNLPRGAALADKWSLIPDAVDVLVTHSPPVGIGDNTKTNGRQGCEDLLARIEQVRPRLHLFGHIHEDGGAWRVGETTHANVTTWECERAPTVIDLEPGAAAPVLIDVPARSR
ncbi:MAG: metallophosphatase domain-containing protein [Polyangiaceae bacterium]